MMFEFVSNYNLHELLTHYSQFVYSESGESDGEAVYERLPSNGCRRSLSVGAKLHLCGQVCVTSSCGYL